MSTTCRLVDKPSANPGDMWSAPAMVEGEHAAYYLEYILSPEYKRDWLGKRAPLIVVLPCRSAFCVDQKATNSENGWTVKGEPPTISCTPSIVYSNTMPDGTEKELWHGFLTNGELTP